MQLRGGRLAPNFGKGCTLRFYEPGTRTCTLRTCFQTRNSGPSIPANIRLHGDQFDKPTITSYRNRGGLPGVREPTVDRISHPYTSLNASTEKRPMGNFRVPWRLRPVFGMPVATKAYKPDETHAVSLTFSEDHAVSLTFSEDHVARARLVLNGCYSDRVVGYSTNAHPLENPSDRWSTDQNEPTKVHRSNHSVQRPSARRVPSHPRHRDRPYRLN